MPVDINCTISHLVNTVPVYQIKITYRISEGNHSLRYTTVAGARGCVRVCVYV